MSEVMCFYYKHPVAQLDVFNQRDDGNRWQVHLLLNFCLQTIKNLINKFFYDEG